MIRDYSRSEMLEIWRRRAGFETTEESCNVEVYDGMDVNEFLEQRMRRWYLGLLDRGDSRLTPVEDVRSSCHTEANAGGCTKLSVPLMTRKLISCRLPGWKRAAAPEEGTTAVLKRESNPYCRADSLHPRVLKFENYYLCFPAASPDFGIPDEVLVTTDTGPELYRVDDSVTGDISREDFEM